MNTTQPLTNGWRQLLNGLAAGLIVLATVMGAVLLASQESGGLTPTVVAIASPSAIPTAAPVTQPPVTAQTSATALPAATQTPTPAATTLPATCPIPAGWQPRSVYSGETLASIASAFGTNVYVLIQGNCLSNADVTPGQTLYVPPPPTRVPGPTATRVPCGPPLTWIIYRVQPGDTLYLLSIRYGVSVYTLAQANCLTGYILRVGQPLYVPPVIIVPPHPTATRIHIPTPTFTPIIIASPTATTSPSVTPSHTPGISPSPSTIAPSVTPPPLTPTATGTPAPPTATSEVPPTASATLPPSATLLPTDTLPPPSATSAPPTDTPVPPSATSAPPTNTPLPPSATSAPPTATSAPPPTEQPAPSSTPAATASP